MPFISSNLCRATLFLIASTTPLLAATYYVDQSNTGAQDGSAANPYVTISQAAAVMSNGDTCIIHAGTYREAVTVQDDNVTFQRNGDDVVVVSGADLVTGWTLHSGNIYKAPLTWSGGHQFTQVFYNGEHQQIARYPDNTTGEMLDVSLASGYADVVTYNEDPATETTRQVTFTGMSGFANDHWAGGYYRGITGWIRSNTLGDIISSSGTDLTCTPLSDQWINNNLDWAMGGDAKGYILHLNALSIAGEWWHESGFLYFWQPGGGAPDDTSVEAQVREEAFVINGRSGVTLSGIDIKAAVVTVSNSNSCRFEHCSFEYLHPFYKAQGYSSWYGDVGGVYISGNNNVVDSCYFAGSWGHLLYIDSGSGNQVLNSVFQDNGWYSTFSSCVHNRLASDTLIEYCTFGSTGRFHVRTDANEKITIKYCDFSDCMNLGQDAGSIQSVGKDLSNSEFAYNTLRESDTIHLINTGIDKQFVVAFYLEDCLNYTVHHNLVWDINNDGLPNAYEDGTFTYLGPRYETISGLKYYNNTVWDCDWRIRIWNRGTGALTANYWNNIFDNSMGDVYGTPSLQSGFDFQNNVSVAPASAATYFEENPEGNFGLLAGAGAIDAGQVIAGITDGYLGSAPDAGAIESGTYMWRTGASIEGNWRQQPYNGTPHDITGSLISAADYDKGGIGIAYHDLSRDNTGGAYRTSEHVDLVSTAYGVAVANTVGGEWLEYTVNAAAGDYTLRLKASAALANRSIRVQLDGTDLATLPIPVTGSINTYQFVETPVTIPSQTTEGRLRVCFDTGGTNLEFIEFLPDFVASTPEATLSANEFNPRPTGVFGFPSEGVIDFYSGGPNNDTLPSTASPSPWKADFQWTGLDLDGLGGADDVIYFTLVAYGSVDDFATLENIQAAGVGWGVFNSILDVGESMLFEIEDVYLSAHTEGFVIFDGYTAAQLIKRTAPGAGTQSTGTVNGTTVTFLDAEAIYTRKGSSFDETSRVVFETTSVNGITLSARDFDLKFSYYSDTVGVGYPGWLANNSLTGSSSVFDADPDDDGLDNLAEYILNGNPGSATDTGVAPHIQRNGGSLEFVHLQRNDPAGEFIHQLESSTSLIAPAWQDSGYTPTGSSDLGNGFDEVIYTLPWDATQKYFRLSVDTQ